VTERFLVSRPCPFLGDDNHCTVYEDRPRVCQDYPHLYKKGFRSRTFGVLNNLRECPVVFNVWESLKEQLRRRR
jgi:uncharacterized protein